MIPESIAFQQAVGNTHLIVPAPPKELRESTDAATWRAFGAELGAIAARCASDSDTRLRTPACIAAEEGRDDGLRLADHHDRRCDG